MTPDAETARLARGRRRRSPRVGPCASERAWGHSSGGRQCRPGTQGRFRPTPEWHNLLAIHEYFDGDRRCGVGASHQTGWTGLVADLLLRFARQRRAVGSKWPPSCPHHAPGTAWCWSGTAAEGVPARAVDSPGHGLDRALFTDLHGGEPGFAPSSTPGRRRRSRRPSVRRGGRDARPAVVRLCGTWRSLAGSRATTEGCAAARPTTTRAQREPVLDGGRAAGREPFGTPASTHLASD